MFLLKKKSPLKLSFDLDDTLVSFKQHYEDRFGIPKSDLEITKNVVGVLKKDKSFWLSQPVIRRPENVHIYCTARIIKKQWIREQIKLNSFPDKPVYQVPGVGLSKYYQLKRSGSDVHIDDSLSVFKDLISKGFPCLLIDSSHNQNNNPIGRIYSFDKDEIESAYYHLKELMNKYGKNYYIF